MSDYLLGAIAAFEYQKMGAQEIIWNLVSMLRDDNEWAGDEIVEALTGYWVNDTKVTQDDLVEALLKRNVYTYARTGIDFTQAPRSKKSHALVKTTKYYRQQYARWHYGAILDLDDAIAQVKQWFVFKRSGVVELAAWS